jgi:hypothetical protein
MKKLLAILIIISLIGLTGCDEPIAFTENGCKIYPPETAGTLRRIKFDNHIYIIRNENYRGGICHDPDCPCMKKKILERE